MFNSVLNAMHQVKTRPLSWAGVVLALLCPIFAANFLAFKIAAAQNVIDKSEDSPYVVRPELVLGNSRESARFGIPSFFEEERPLRLASVNLPGIRSGVDPLAIETAGRSNVAVSFPAPMAQNTYVPPAMDRTEFANYYYPVRNLNDPVVITAKEGWSKKVNNTEVYVLEGDCIVQQGSSRASGPRAVVWVHESDPARRMPREVTVYLESNGQGNLIRVELDVEQQYGSIEDKKWLSTFSSNNAVNVYIGTPRSAPMQMPTIYGRAMRYRDGGDYAIQQTQLLVPNESGIASSLTKGKEVPIRRLHFHSRTDFPMTIRQIEDPISGRSTGIITDGFRIIIEGIKLEGNDSKALLSGDILDISADRGLVWMEQISGIKDRDVKTQSQEHDFEIYMEGDIVVRQGEREIRADRMYYDAKNNVGLIINSEMVMPLDETSSGFEGLIRMRSEVLQQMGQGSFRAHNSYVTTSMIGEPEYRINSKYMTLEEKANLRYDAQSGAPIIDPGTGKPKVEKNYHLVSESNSIYYRSVPFLYWPWMATDLRDTTYYISGFKYAHNGTFGHQFLTEWNPWQLFNCKNRPDGCDWDLSLDYLSERGLGHGTNFRYSRDDFFIFPGISAGIADFYGIYDNGNSDNLGYKRREVTFPQKYRYRAFWNHRQALPNDWVLSAELGKSSDRHFMEQYFGTEWDTKKDQSTTLELKKINGNHSFSLFGSARLDDFVTDTSWLPKAEFTWIGQSLLEDVLTWHSYTAAGVGQFRTATDPEDPSDAALYNNLPWEMNGDGTGTLRETSEMFSSRHELDAPFNLGPFRFVPYVLGEFAHWGKDRDGESVDRFYGQVGVRANLPIWKLDPKFHSRLFYANGLAHKVDFDAEFLYARADTGYDRLVMYDAMDDNSTEDFRRRFSVTTFLDGNIPVRFDERYYAIRSGIGRNVTSPNTELLDDMTQMRLGMRHRWQTKRGAVGRRHIIDWITLSTNLTIYPENEQNFGESLGMMDYDFRWHVGDRFTVLSSGIFDLFDGGQKIVRAGFQSYRPGRGSIYLGLDHLEGPFCSTYLNLNLDYEMNEKYSMSYGTSFDLNSGRNQGQNLKITRAGESFRFSLGFSYDWSRNETGVSFDVVPSFLYAYNHRHDRDRYPGVIPR